MGLLRRHKAEATETSDAALDAPRPAEEDDGDDHALVGYSRIMEERMRRLDDYSYDFDESEAAEVEARLRRMFYGAKVEDD